jgi:DNA-binding GntR family transcriptional regulator
MVTDSVPTEEAQEVKSRVQYAYDHLRAGIIDGHYPPGSSLRLQALAQELSVSAIPVREALRMLETERLVVISANRGARVAPLSLEDVVDAYETRILMEVESLRRSAPKLVDSDLDDARRVCHAMVAALENKDPDAFRLHRELHYILYSRAESPWLQGIMDILWDHTERYRRLATPLRGDAGDIAKEHLRIIDAIAVHDVDEATGALEAHLGRTVSVLRSLSLSDSGNGSFDRIAGEITAGPPWAASG